MKRSSEVKSSSTFLLCRFLFISFVRFIAVNLFHQCKKRIINSYFLYVQFSDRISNFRTFISCIILKLECHIHILQVHLVRIYVTNSPYLVPVVHYSNIYMTAVLLFFIIPKFILKRRNNKFS